MKFRNYKMKIKNMKKNENYYKNKLTRLTIQKIKSNYSLQILIIKYQEQKKKEKLIMKIMNITFKSINN